MCVYIKCADVTSFVVEDYTELVHEMWKCCSVVDITAVLVSRKASFFCGSYHDMFIFPAHLGTGFVDRWNGYFKTVLVWAVMWNLNKGMQEYDTCHSLYCV